MYPPSYSTLTGLCGNGDSISPPHKDDTYGHYVSQDILRNGPRDVAATELASRHPLQEHIEKVALFLVILLIFPVVGPY